MTPSILNPSRAEIIAVFSLLLNLYISTMEKVLEVCSLSWRKGTKSKPTIHAWENFIVEYKLDIEVTTFNINNKHWYFFKNGSFDASRHAAKIPIYYWRDQNNKEVSPPKLWINKLTAIFVESVGSMGISVDISHFDNSDANIDNIGMDSDAESVAPSIEQPIEIKIKHMVRVSFFHACYCFISS